MDEDAPMDAFTGWRLVLRLPTSWKDMFADFVDFLVCLECFLWAYDEAKKYFPSVIRKFLLESSQGFFSIECCSFSSADLSYVSDLAFGLLSNVKRPEEKTIASPE